jgi:hypothetical protein
LELSETIGHGARKEMKRKWLAAGIILLFVGASITPSISGNSGQREKTFLQFNEPNPADETISDWIEDVYSANQNGTTTLIANSTDIEVDNIDILQITCTQQELQVNLTLRVAGMIEDRGGFINGSVFDNEVVEYYFELITSEQHYLIRYWNQTGELQYDNESINLTSSDFSVVDDTLSIWFSLMNHDEKFEKLYAGSTYFKVNKLEPDSSEIVYLYDLVPNILGKAVCIGLIHNRTTTRDYILFNPILMTSILLIPFNVYPLSKGPIIVSRNYLGYVGHRFIIGLFDVDLSIFWPAQNPNFLTTHQILNPLHREL